MATIPVGRAVAIVAAAGLLPIISNRLSISPTTLILLIPVLAVAWALSWIATSVGIAYLLDKRTARWRGQLSEHAQNLRQDERGGFGAWRRLTFATPAAWSVIQTRNAWEASNTSFREPVHPSSDEVSRSADEVIYMIMRDFVHKWFDSISPDPAFPHAVERTIREALANVLQRFKRIDLTTMAVNNILPKVTAHLEAFRKAETSLRGQRLERHLTESEEADLFLAAKYADGQLHPAVNVSSPNSKPSEEAHLRSLVAKALPLTLPHRESSSDAVVTIVREIVACAILLPIVDMLSDPDFWNRMIDQKAGAVIHEQHLVSQFRDALDKQGSKDSAVAATAVAAVNVLKDDMDEKPQARAKLPLKGEELSARTDQKSWEVFLRSISKCSSLLDARRLKNDIVMQIRRTNALIDDPAKAEAVDEKPARLQAHLRRLQDARQRAERRIAELSGQEQATSAPDQDQDSRSLPTAANISLRDILLEPTSLSYFMEFMDRRKRSLPVQFWLIAESFKDPLEDMTSDSEDDDSLKGPTMPAPSPAAVQTARDDMQMIYSTYFSSGAIHFKPQYIEAVRWFLERGPDAPIEAKQLRRVRRSVFMAQKQVYDEMNDDDFAAFRASDLFLKATADMPVHHLTSTVSDPSRSAPSSQQPPDLLSDQHHPDLSLSLANKPYKSPVAPLQISSQELLSLPSLVAAPKNPAARFKEQNEFFPGGSGSGRRTPHQLRDLLGDDYRKERPALPPRVPSDPSSSGRRGSGKDNDHLHILMGGGGSTDDSNVRMPLFGEDEERAPLFDVEERPPLFGEDEEEDARPSSRPARSPASPRTDVSGGTDDFVQVEAIDAVQAALTKIIDSDQRSQTGSVSSWESKERPPRLRHRVTSATSDSEVQGVRAARASSRSPVLSRTNTLLKSPTMSPLSFTPMDDGEAEVGEGSGGGGGGFSDEEGGGGSAAFRMAAPGDLQLSVEIQRLREKIAKLENQEAIVEALIRKAELTGTQSELRLLTQSRHALKRELGELRFQKGQFELQDSENSIVPGRTKVSIPNSTVGKEDGKEHVVYLIEVHQLAPDGSFASGWIVARRYSEFFALHSALKERFVAVRMLDLPGKRLVTMMHSGFVEARRVALEKYLQSLINVPLVCESSELRSFLSQQNISLLRLEDTQPASPGGGTGAKTKQQSFPFPGQKMVSTLFHHVASSMDDIIFAPSMLDVILQRLSTQAAELAGIGASNIHDEDLVARTSSSSVGGLSRSTGDLTSGSGGTGGGTEGVTYFTEPICDLFLEIFELKEKNNWLRRQAIVIILQQVLGGTIERRVRDAVKNMLAANPLVKYIQVFRDNMWPGGQLKPPSPPRTPQEKAQVRESANRKLAALMPALAENVIGRSNARKGARRMFSVLQNRRLNKHLIFTIMDEIFVSLYPEMR